MFLLRSAFWLTVAFILVAPRDADLGDVARTLSTDALAAGQKLIVGEILRSDCHDMQCAAGKVVLTTLVQSTSPSIDTPMQDSSMLPVPIPRPRPDWMG